jgi:hypothetical protein
VTFNATLRGDVEVTSLALSMLGDGRCNYKVYRCEVVRRTRSKRRGDRAR